MMLLQAEVEIISNLIDKSEDGSPLSIIFYSILILMLIGVQAYKKFYKPRYQEDAKFIVNYLKGEIQKDIAPVQAFLDMKWAINSLHLGLLKKVMHYATSRDNQSNDEILTKITRVWEESFDKCENDLKNFQFKRIPLSQFLLKPDSKDIAKGILSDFRNPSFENDDCALYQKLSGGFDETFRTIDLHAEKEITTLSNKK